jgi:hypothetical protein
MTAAVDVDCVVICEDIRQENTGKGIFIGVYTSDISLKSFPQDVVLFVYVGGRVAKSGSFDFQFTIEDGSGGVYFKLDRAAQPPIFNEGRFSASYNAAVSLIKEGILEFYMIDGNERRLLTSRLVQKIPE